MTSISKLAIKNLNDRLLTQNVIVEVLMEIILENGLVTENELELRIQQTLERMQKALSKLHQETSEETFITDEVLEGLYFGPVGEA